MTTINVCAGVLLSPSENGNFRPNQTVHHCRMRQWNFEHKRKYATNGVHRIEDERVDRLCRRMTLGRRQCRTSHSFIKRDAAISVRSL